MKILQINVTANWGSTGHIAEEIAQLTIAQGWESYIAYGRGNPKSKSTLIRIGTDRDMNCHVVQTRLLDNHGLASKQATRIFIKQIDELAPDIIHIHNIHGYYLNYEILFDYLARTKIPIVWTLHDCWTFTGHCSHFSYVKCYRWQTECFSCPQKKEYPKSYFLDRSQKNYRQKKECFTSISNLILVPVSDWLANLLSYSFLSNYTKRVIHNGVDIETFHPVPSVKEKYCNPNKFLMVGVASIWGQRKGLYDFIELAKYIASDEIILLIGLSQKQISELPANILGICRTENVQQLVELYSSADVFLNLTWEDTFPTTNLEALSCGTPIISYDTGGCAEAIDEDTGIIISPGNLKGVINAISDIKKNTKSYYSPKCRERALHHFDKKNKYAEYIKIYSEIENNYV